MGRHGKAEVGALVLAFLRCSRAGVSAVRVFMHVSMCIYVYICSHTLSFSRFLTVSLALSGPVTHSSSTMRWKGGARKSETLGAAQALGAAPVAGAAVAGMERASDAKEEKKNDVAKEAKKYAAPREAGIVCAYKQGEKYGFIKRFDFRSRLHSDKHEVLSLT